MLSAVARVDVLATRAGVATLMTLKVWRVNGVRVSWQLLSGQFMGLFSTTRPLMLGCASLESELSSEVWEPECASRFTTSVKRRTEECVEGWVIFLEHHLTVGFEQDWSAGRIGYIATG